MRSTSALDAAVGNRQAVRSIAQTESSARNYCYQTGAGATLFFEDKYFNPFMSTGGLSMGADVSIPISNSTAPSTVM